MNRYLILVLTLTALAVVADKEHENNVPEDTAKLSPGRRKGRGGMFGGGTQGVVIIPTGQTKARTLPKVFLTAGVATAQQIKGGGSGGGGGGGGGNGGGWGGQSGGGGGTGGGGIGWGGGGNSGGQGGGWGGGGNIGGGGGWGGGGMGGGGFGGGPGWGSGGGMMGGGWGGGPGWGGGGGGWGGGGGGWGEECEDKKAMKAKKKAAKKKAKAKKKAAKKGGGGWGPPPGWGQGGGGQSGGGWGGGGGSGGGNGGGGWGGNSGGGGGKLGGGKGGGAWGQGGGGNVGGGGWGGGGNSLGGGWRSDDPESESEESSHEENWPNSLPRASRVDDSPLTTYDILESFPYYLNIDPSQLSSLQKIDKKSMGGEVSEEKKLISSMDNSAVISADMISKSLGGSADGLNLPETLQLRLICPSNLWLAKGVDTSTCYYVKA